MTENTATPAELNAEAETVVTTENITENTVESPAVEAEETTAAQPAASQSREERAVKFIDALGGVDNFKNIDACITRLRLSLVDQHKINEEQLKSLGAKGIVKIGNDGLQVVLGPEAELVAEAMKQKVK